MRKLLIPDISFLALDESGKPQRVSAALQLQQLASVPSQPGATFTIDEIRKRLPLVDKLAGAVANEHRELLLEDSEYDILLQAATTSMWGGVSHNADELIRAVEEAEAVGVKEDTGSPSP